MRRAFDKALLYGIAAFLLLPLAVEAVLALRKSD